MTTFLFYFIVEICSCGFFWIGQNNKKNKYLWQFFAFLLLFLVIVLRNVNVGTDYMNYILAINRVANNTMTLTDSNWLSIGFRTLIKIMAHLFPLSVNSIYFSISVVGIVTFLTLLFFFYSFNYDKDTVFELYLFFCFCLYFQMMNQFRQLFAVSIVLFAYKYVNKSFIKYELLIILATLFHGTAIIMLPMYFFGKIRVNKKILGLYSILAVILFVFSTFVKALIQYTSYSEYIGWSEFDKESVITAIFNFGVRFILMIICLFFINEVIKDDPKRNFLYHMVIICTILQLLVAKEYIFARITIYFFVYYIILIPVVFEKSEIFFKRNSILIEKIIVFLAFFVYQIVYYLSQANIGGYSVYRFL